MATLVVAEVAAPPAAGDGAAAVSARTTTFVLTLMPGRFAGLSARAAVGTARCSTETSCVSTPLLEAAVGCICGLWFHHFENDQTATPTSAIKARSASSR